MGARIGEIENLEGSGRRGVILSHIQNLKCWRDVESRRLCRIIRNYSQRIEWVRGKVQKKRLSTRMPVPKKKTKA